MKDFYYKHLNRFKSFLLDTLYKDNIIIKNCEILEDGTINVNNNTYEKYGFIMHNILIGCTISCKHCNANILDKDGVHINHECTKGE